MGAGAGGRMWSKKEGRQYRGLYADGNDLREEKPENAGKEKQAGEMSLMRQEEMGSSEVS